MLFVKLLLDIAISRYVLAMGKEGMSHCVLTIRMIYHTAC